MRSGSRLASVNDAPQFLGPQHHVDVLHAEPAQPVNRGGDDAGRRAQRARFTDTFGTEWIDGSWRDGAVKFEMREIGCTRERVVHERAGHQLTVVVVDGLLDHRLANPLRKAAVNLSFYD